MREAFTYMFKDNCFWKKALPLFLVSLISGLMLCYGNNHIPSGCPLGQTPQVAPVANLQVMGVNFLGWLIGLLVTGYYFVAVKAISGQEKNIVLPFFNIWQCFVKGLKALLSFFLLGLVLGTFFTLLSILVSLMNNVLSIVFFIVILGLAMFFFVMFVALLNYRANTDKILAIFAWKKAYQLMVANRVDYGWAVWYLIVCDLAVAAILTLVILIGVFFFPAAVFNEYVILGITTLIGTYVLFVQMYLTAKAVKPTEVVE